MDEPVNLIEIAAKNGIEGFMHPCEVEKLTELAAGREVLEVGSFKGLSAWAMGFSAKSLTAVDTFKANSGGQLQGEENDTLPDFKRAIARYSHYHVSHYVGTSEEARRVLTSDYDMIFLDANHELQAVRRDIELWHPRVRPGGVLVFHDYGHSAFPGVKEAVDEVFGSLGAYDPPNQDWVVTLRWVQL